MNIYEIFTRAGQALSTFVNGNKADNDLRRQIKAEDEAERRSREEGVPSRYRRP